MSTTSVTFQEAPLGARPIRELGLKIAGTALEPILAEFETELRNAGIRRVRPQFYLSTEWGVPFGTITIAIPFYLAQKELTELHAERCGYVEGANRADIMRYLRHEMGHVVNYAYKLYDQEEWVKHFGSITQPYAEDYRPSPFSRRHVNHLPGWYAQKHPDEDWAETFAVWMTPQLDWSQEYGDWPEALAKLKYCDRTMKGLEDRDPAVCAEELDEDVSELSYSVDQFYHDRAPTKFQLPRGLDGALRNIFDDSFSMEGNAVLVQPASALIRSLERDLMMNIFLWTGHFPEHTQLLLQHLAERADQLKLGYPKDRERSVTLAFTTLVTALAMNYVHHGAYQPEAM